MAEAVLKALKWYVMALSGVIGCSAFIIVGSSGAVFPWIIAVLGFGVVYIMSYFWKEFRGKILFASVAVFTGITFVSSYVPDILYVLFDINLFSYNKYSLWAITMLLGIPVMAFAFRYIDEG